MPSQTDLDQGGTFRQTGKVYMGPSIGWVAAPDQSILPIVAGGTTILARGMTLVTVNFNGLVTIQLPSSKASLAGPSAIPGQFVITPVVIVDVGGFAGANNVTILPFAGELIDGLAQIKITTPYGAYVLQPQINTGGWTLQQ